MPAKFSYYMPTKLFFGKGSLNRLKKIKLPGTKAFLVTGGSSTTRLGYVDRVVALLKEKGVETVIFNKVLPNPNHAHVNEGAQIIRQEGCDFLIGIGGGSSVDSAKAMAMAAVNPGDCWQYIFGGEKIKNKPLPVIAIPTTAGTGTEADPWTVITNEQTNEKIGFGGDLFYPAISIVDCELMMSVPPFLTACQGFDALFHAVEGYIAKIASPISDMFALKSIQLIGENLARAVENGDDEEARGNVAMASTISGIVESLSCCTSEHAMEHAMSAFYPKLTHGAGLIIISAAYHSHLAKALPQRYIDMAKALGKKDAQDPMDFVQALVQLQKDCGVEQLKMSDYGIKKEDAARFADNAYETGGSMISADRAPVTKEDMIRIYEAAFR